MTKQQFLLKSSKPLGKDYYVVKAKGKSAIVEKDTKPGKFLRVFLPLFGPIAILGFSFLYRFTNDKLIALYLNLVRRNEPNIIEAILVAVVIATIWISLVYLIAYLFVPSEVKDIELT